MIGAAAFLPPDLHAAVVEIPGPEGPLAGEMIPVPDASHAAIIVPGSGPIDRDGNGAGVGLSSDTYKHLAEGLAHAGIASIRIDKRGFFGSAAAVTDPEDVTIAAYADDVVGWVSYAARLAPCVWVIGHSEGGLVALASAARRPSELCGVVLVATAGRPIGRVLVEQMRSNPATVQLAEEVDAIVDDLEAGRTRSMETISPALHALFTPGLQRYMLDLFAHDPAEIVKAWPGPLLVLQGDADMQIGMQDADILVGAQPTAERVDLPGATHMLKREVPGRPWASYMDPALPLHPDVVPAIAEFVARRGADRLRRPSPD